MTMKPQTKFNAKRSAETATRKTGIEHSTREVAGGWIVMPADADITSPSTEDVAPAAPTLPDTASEDAVAREAAAVADALDTASTAPTRATLRQAADAVLTAWDDEANRETDIIGELEGPMATLRTALAKRTSRTDPTRPRAPRTGTKQEVVLSLLRRPEGATIAQVVEATGWQQHTVRGFLAGLKKKGTQVDVLERIRQVGPNKDGAKGSYSIYRVA